MRKHFCTSWRCKTRDKIKTKHSLSSYRFAFYSSSSQQLQSTKMFFHLSNKAHFGMPFHGREKPACGRCSKPLLSLFPQKKLHSPHTCVLSNSNITLLQYCIADISKDTHTHTHSIERNRTSQLDHIKS